MKNCVRCGKKIDVIAKDQDSIYYCQKCNDDLLDKIGKKNTKEIFSKVKEKKLLYILIPGLFQISRGEYLEGIMYFFSGLLLPLFWFFLFYFEIIMNIIDSKITGVNIIFSLFILINSILVYINNGYKYLR